MPTGKKSVTCGNPACALVGQAQLVGARKVACNCGRRFDRKTIAAGVPAAAK